MPSPAGHALGGLAVGWLIARRQPGGGLARAALFAAAAIAPDLDLLAGGHRGPSHGIGAAALAGLAAWLLTPPSRPSGERFQLAAAVAAAWASHTLLDWLGSDSRPPIGVMALWPFSHDYYESPLHLFPAISRRYWLAEFWVYNLRALAWELLILGPVAAGVHLVRSRGAHGS